MRRICMALLVVTLIACGDTVSNSPTVWGECRFCGKPGYSNVNYLDINAAQRGADNGDAAICGSIVCESCRKSATVAGGK